MPIGVRGRIVTMDNDRRYIPDGVVIVDEKSGMILDVLEYRQAPDHGLEYIVGDREAIVTPGLVNTHTHIPMAIFKGILIGYTGIEWLKRVWAMEACLDRETVYLGALAGISELVLSGTTLFGDMYFYEDMVARAAREIGVRASLSLGVIELFEGPPRHSIEESTRFAESLRGDSLVRGLIGVHSLYSVTIDSIKRASEHSMDRGLRIHMHFAESPDEIRLLRERYGRTPVEIADEIGLLRARPLLAHAVYVSDREVEVLARYRPYISYCPFTIMSWGSEVAPVLSYIDKGIPVTLGTDGPLTAGWTNILFEAKVAYAAQGSRYGRPTPFDPYRLLSDSIRVGAEALGWVGVGAIKKGYRADIVVWSPRIRMSIRDHVEASHRLIYDHGLFNAEYVIIDGRIIVSGGRLMGLDLDRLYEKLIDAREKLLGCAGG